MKQQTSFKKEVVFMDKMMILEAIKVMAVEANREEIVEYVDKEIETVKTRIEKETQAKEEKAKVNAALRDKIVEILTNATEPMRAGEIAKELGVSPQKATYILRGMKEEGLVKPTVEKRTTVYTIV